MEPQEQVPVDQDTLGQRLGDQPGEPEIQSSESAALSDIRDVVVNQLPQALTKLVDICSQSLRPSQKQSDPGTNWTESSLSIYSEYQDVTKGQVLCKRFAQGQCDREECRYLHDEFLKRMYLKWRGCHEHDNGMPADVGNYERIQIRLTGRAYSAYLDQFPQRTTELAGLPDWKSNLRSQLSHGTKQPVTSAILPDELISHLTWSLFGTEATHPEFKGESKETFEFSRSPKLYWFLARHAKPAVSNLDEGSTWDIILAIVSLCGHVVANFLEHEDMIKQTRPTRTTDWTTEDIVRQLLDELMYSCRHVGDNTQSEQFPVPQVVLGHLETAAALLAEEASPALRRFLDDLTNVIVEYYLVEPRPHEWQREYSRPILEFPIHHRHRRHGGHYSINWDVDDVEAMPLGMMEKEIQFSPSDLSMETIRKLDRGWKVQWTSSLARHLLLLEEKTILVYWPSTNIMRRPKHPKNLLLPELRRTYALLFGTTSTGLARRREEVKEKIWQDVRRYYFHNRHSFTRTKAGFHFSNCQENITDHRMWEELLQPYFATYAPDDMLRIYGWPSRTTIGNLVKNGKVDNQDLYFHVQGILMYPCQDEERFENFPYFGDRIRLLSSLLREQKPRTFSQIWRDSRDTMQWWTFWLVIIVGIPSLLLAIGSLAVSGAQTWAAFKALNST